LKHAAVGRSGIVWPRADAVVGFDAKVSTAVALARLRPANASLGYPSHPALGDAHAAPCIESDRSDP